jgi:hypothetical protein
MQSQANGVLAKDSKIAEIQNYNSYFKRNGFYTYEAYNQSIQ